MPTKASLTRAFSSSESSSGMMGALQLGHRQLLVEMSTSRAGWLKRAVAVTELLAVKYGYSKRLLLSSLSDKLVVRCELDICLVCSSNT
jgi:hypothetical protein